MSAPASIGKRLLALTAALGSMFAVGAASAQTGPSPVQSPPAEWLAYAATVTDAVTAWLEADTDAAIRMRSWLDATRSPAEEPSPLMEIKVWLASDGRVTRVEGPIKNEVQAETDMAEIAATALFGPPPPDMPQPLRIGVQLASH